MDVVNLKVVFVNDHAVLSWETNISSTCKVSFCREGTCFITDPTPLETLHMIDLPKDASEVTIYITGNDESYVEVPIDFSSSYPGENLTEK